MHVKIRALKKEGRERTSVQKGRRPVASSISHHVRKSANDMFHRWISSCSCPNGSGFPFVMYGFRSVVSVSNSQRSMSTLRMSMCECPCVRVSGARAN
jgi:hypothetical protein